MSVTIRPATPADYPGAVAAMREGNPRSHVSVEALEASAKRAREHPLGLHLAQWVAEDGGEVVAFAGVAQWPGSHHPDRYHAMLATAASRAGQGIGAQLAQTVENHLRARGAREVLAGAYEDRPHAVAFLTRRGFRERSRSFDNVLKLAGVPAQAPPALPGGLRLTTLADLIEEKGRDAALEAFRQTFNEARADEPRTVAAQPYTPEDMQTYLDHPTYFPQGLLLAVTDSGEVAALSELWLDLSDPARLHNGLTGTARAWRGRGLATTLKLAGLEVARKRGAQDIWTSNDTTNAPMLAINTKLGFRPEPAYVEMVWGGIAEPPESEPRSLDMTTSTLPDLHIRDATPDDDAAVAALLSAVFPDHPTTAESLAQDREFFQASSVRPHLWDRVAEVGGQIVGRVSVAQMPGMFHPDRYHAELGVHPDWERRGVGTRLAAELTGHLHARGAREVLAGTYETRPHAVMFLHDRGFAEVMRFFDNVLDLSAFRAEAWAREMALPPGLRAVSHADLAQEMGQDAADRAFYAAFAEARADVPRTAPATELSFEDFVGRFKPPFAYPEGIFLAVTDAGEVVALSELWRSEAGAHRLEIGLTGTRRAWRRKGLALALKLCGMALAQRSGVTELWTGNATTNRPMLALNEKLGFRPRPAYIEMKWGGVEEGSE